MKIIPVLDIKQGQAVLAKQGRRDQYRPIDTALCGSSRPAEVIQSFLALYPFPVIYIADLDAISGHTCNLDLIGELCAHFSTIEFLIDCGNLHDLWRITDKPPENACPVLGTECYTSVSELTRDLSFLYRWQPIISLDFKNGTLVGCANILQQVDVWTERLILLNIDAVGSSSGVDLKLLQEISSKNPHSNLIVGGGIRGLDDLLQLRRLGVDGALIATCLHQKNLSTTEIEQLISA
jgi:phosphoribosylformimino-5-aminoimidazole carboxamide ribotide isomerase